MNNMKAIIELFIFAFVVVLFIQTNKEVWNEYGKDLFEKLINRMKTTSIGMWVNNKLNKVDILTDREYAEILINTKGELKTIIIK